MSTSAFGRLLLLLFLLSPLFVACGEEVKEEKEAVVVTDADKPEKARSGEFTSEEGEFRLTFPEGSVLPQEELVPIPTEFGSVDMHNLQVLRESDAFMAAWADFPDSLSSRSGPQELLALARDGAIFLINGELIQQETASVQGFPALEIYARGQLDTQDIAFRAQLILADHRLYQVVYMANDESALDSEVASSYFASFRIDRSQNISDESSAEAEGDVAGE